MRKGPPSDPPQATTRSGRLTKPRTSCETASRLRAKSQGGQLARRRRRDRRQAEDGELPWNADGDWQPDVEQATGSELGVTDSRCQAHREGYRAENESRDIPGPS